MSALPDNGSFLERFKRGELTSGEDGNGANSASSASSAVIDPMHPMLLEACKLLTERTAASEGNMRFLKKSSISEKHIYKIARICKKIPGNRSECLQRLRCLEQR
jgi:hypothetical protein